MTINITSLEQDLESIAEQRLTLTAGYDREKAVFFQKVEKGSDFSFLVGDKKLQEFVLKNLKEILTMLVYVDRRYQYKQPRLAIFVETMLQIDQEKALAGLEYENIFFQFLAVVTKVAELGVEGTRELRVIGYRKVYEQMVSLIGNPEVLENLSFETLEAIAFSTMSYNDIDTFKKILEIPKVKDQIHRNDNAFLFEFVSILRKMLCECGHNLFDHNNDRECLMTGVAHEDFQGQAMQAILSIKAVSENAHGQDNRVIKKLFLGYEGLSATTFPALEALLSIDTVINALTFEDLTEYDNLLWYALSYHKLAIFKRLLYSRHNQNGELLCKLDQWDEYVWAMNNNRFNHIIEIGKENSLIRLKMLLSFPGIKGYTLLDFQETTEDELKEMLEKVKPAAALMLLEESFLSEALTDRGKQHAYNHIKQTLVQSEWSFFLIKYKFFREHCLSSEELRESFFERCVKDHPLMIQIQADMGQSSRPGMWVVCKHIHISDLELENIERPSLEYVLTKKSFLDKLEEEFPLRQGACKGLSL